MIHLLVMLKVKDPANVAKVAELLSEQGRRSREEPGCARFEAYHSTSDATCFTLCEWWETQEALDAHRLAAAYNEVYKPHVLPLVDRVPHPSQLLP